VTTVRIRRLRTTYGNATVVLRKYQGLVTYHCGYVTNLLRFCYGITGSDRVKPRSHYGVDGMLRLCNGSVTVSTVMTRFDWP